MTGDEGGAGDEGGTDEGDPGGADEPADAAAAAIGATPREPEWPVVESVVEYETPWYTGGYDLVEQPDGSRKRYYWAALAPAVVVVPVTDGQVVFVEQYRPVIRETQLELPAGIVEAGETHSEAAARELREETGFDPSGTSLLGEVQVATGLLRHPRGYVFAEGLTPVEQDLDGNEFLSVRAVPVEEAIDAVRSRARDRAAATNDATLQGLMLAADEGLL